MSNTWVKRIMFAVFLLVGVGLALPGIELYRVYYQPMRVDASNPPVIILRQSSTAISFVNDLKNHHLVASSTLLLKLIRAQHLTTALQAGVYQVKPGESVWQLLQRVVRGDVLTQQFRIISGSTWRKVAENLANAPYLYYKKTDWIDIDRVHANPEGLLLADTYQYGGGSSSKTLLLQAHRNLLNYLQEIWQHRDPSLPYRNPYELLIAASILEKETSRAEEKSIISGIIVNRLQKNMPLQMDPTVLYGLADQHTGKLTHQDIQQETAYNTYHHRGLPPTPIAMVAKDAILAAAHPLHSDYLYFVAKGDGTHQFSRTYAEQKRAIHQYQYKPAIAQEKQ